VFADGVALRLRDDFRDRGPDFVIYGGARLRFSRRAALTFRIGHRRLRRDFVFSVKIEE